MLQTAFMATFVPYDRSQAFLLPPDLKEWLPGDDLAHFIVAAVERVPLASFKVNPQAGGRPQYQRWPRKFGQGDKLFPPA